MLDKVRLTISAVGRRIVLARFGKDETLALERRDAANEFWQTLVSYSFDGQMPEPGQSVEVQFGGGDEQFTMTLTRTALPQSGGPDA